MTSDQTRSSQDPIKPEVIVLPDGWFTYVVAQGVDTTRPGLYEWHIAGVGSYVGKYTHIDRPTLQYARNVSNLLNNLPYRPGNPGGFRSIHRALEAAHKAGKPITLTILENVEADRINAREQELIDRYGTLNQTLRRT